MSRVAHSTAHALLARVRADPDGEVVDRLVAFTDEHGIDDLAELWSRSPSRSPARRAVAAVSAAADDPRRRRRRRRCSTSADAPSSRRRTRSSPARRAPPGPDELVALIDTILRGLFEGDFAVALERAAAFCRVQAAGASHLADDYEPTEPERASTLTARALRLADYASDICSAVRRAVAARRADLRRAARAGCRRASRRQRKCRAAERLSAHGRSRRQKMEPGVTAARLNQCNRGTRFDIPEPLGSTHGLAFRAHDRPRGIRRRPHRLRRHLHGRRSDALRR